MAFDVAAWNRLEFDGTPIYVRPDKPDWFVPNAAGDNVLQQLAVGVAWRRLPSKSNAS